MLKSTAALTALLATLMLTPAFAAPPADQDACNSLAYSLAEKAAGKKLPEAQAIKVDELIGKLEGQCTENKFAEADATAKEIDAALK
jgi:hypothetical protein